MLETLIRDLRQPEYIHVLINPLPVYGLAISLVGLIVALFLRSRPAQVTALVLVLVTAASAWPVAHYGEEAEDRVLAMADNDGQAWLEAHAHRADNLIYFFYALALLSAAAIFIPMKWPKSAMPLTIATLLLAIVSLGAGGYIAYAGGKIRHREFRNEPPPPKKTQTEESS
jgi:disulfide bond formation protein DsbB